MAAAAQLDRASRAAPPNRISVNTMDVASARQVPWVRWCVIVALAAAVSGARAGDSAPQRPATVRERFLDWPHDRLSHLVERVAQGADSLLSGNRDYDAPTGSYAVLGEAVTAYRGEDAADSHRAITRLKLNLPRTEDRLQVLIDRGLATLTRSDAQRDAEVAAGQTASDNSPFAALRLLVVDVLRLRVTTDVGARIRVPFDPFARLRADRSVPLGPWTALFSQTFLYSRQNDFQSNTQMAFQRPLASGVSFALVSDVTWRSPEQAFQLSQTATLLWQQNERTLVGFEAGVLGTTEPRTEVTAYSFSARWRRQVYRQWLILEARPQLVYARDRGFRPLPSLTVQVEAFFGQGFLR